LQKNFCFLSEKPRGGASQREKEFFFAKKILFLSFRVFKNDTLFISHSKGIKNRLFLMPF
jgi:hypothetical protein